MTWRRNLFGKIDIEVHPDNVEACHWINPNAGSKNDIIKISRCKYVNKIQRAK